MENIYTETYLQKYLHGDSKLETSEKCFTIGIFGKEFKILRLSRIIICFNAECLSKFLNHLVFVLNWLWKMNFIFSLNTTVCLLTIDFFFKLSITLSTPEHHTIGVWGGGGRASAEARKLGAVNYSVKCQLGSVMPFIMRVSRHKAESSVTEFRLWIVWWSRVCVQDQGWMGPIVYHLVAGCCSYQCCSASNCSYCSRAGNKPSRSFHNPG